MAQAHGAPLRRDARPQRRRIVIRSGPEAGAACGAVRVTPAAARGCRESWWRETPCPPAGARWARSRRRTGEATTTGRGRGTAMARQVIRQPDGLYAVFSTGVTGGLPVTLPASSTLSGARMQAVREARADAARLLDDLEAGQYYAGYTFEEANAASVEHGGEDLSGKAATVDRRAVVRHMRLVRQPQRPAARTASGRTAAPHGPSAPAGPRRKRPDGSCRPPRSGSPSSSWPLAMPSGIRRKRPVACPTRSRSCSRPVRTLSSR